MASTALIRSLAWEPPYATGAALEKAKKEKEKRKESALGFTDFFPVFFFFFFLIHIFISFLFRAAPVANGNSQAMGRRGATAAGHTGSDEHLQLTPQLAATMDP